MPTRNVVLTDHQADLLDRLVKEGRYQNASEAVREGLRNLESREAEIADLTRRADNGLKEMKQGLGGGYGLGFDSEGNVVDYKPLLQGTTRNCGGGVSPWGSWLTCEEYGKGQCWQVGKCRCIVSLCTLYD